MAGRQDDAAIGLAFADEVGRCRRRQQSVLCDDDALKPVGGCHADDGLDRAIVEVPSVAAQHQRLAGKAADRIEGCLGEVFQEVRLHEDRGLLAQARCARLLPLDRCRRNRMDLRHKLAPSLHILLPAGRHHSAPPGTRTAFCAITAARARKPRRRRPPPRPIRAKSRPLPAPGVPYPRSGPTFSPAVPAATPPRSRRRR